MTRDHDMVGPRLEFGCDPYHGIDNLTLTRYCCSIQGQDCEWQDMCQWRGNGFRMVKGGRVLKW